MVFAQWQNINPGQDYNEWETKARRVSSATSENTMVNGADHNSEQPRREVLPEEQV